MAHFNTKDQQMLEEAYQNIQEGRWDRFKARGAEAIGSAKGMGQQFKGGLQQAAGSALGVLNKQDGDRIKQQGNQNVRSGQASGHNSKIEYLKKNMDQRIQKFVEDIKNDIQKLGLDIGNIEMVSGINDALNSLKMSVEATPPPLPQQATPPPLPNQDDDSSDDDGDNNVSYNEDDYVDADGVASNQKKKPDYKSRGYEGKTDLSDVSNMSFKYSNDLSDEPGPMETIKNIRKAAAQKGNETKKRNAAKQQTDQRKGKPRQFQDRQFKELTTESLEDMFWR